ncbi:polysaccharide deacetylase family protein [Filobacillus milosensis]|uniref:polysaccharide deacetylase family protein n=1 Tax=Filobacillus milosensis TaxID=94137 RepID=UPI001891A042|nr:hypothetical protein [Filobacillus milosensis]
MNNGKFVISLDFELNWGVHDCLPVEQYINNLLGVRAVIPMVLELFSKHNIHATWATVGFLFFSNKKDLLKALPVEQPAYENEKLSSYAHLENVGFNEDDDRLHYGSELIELIKRHDNQEIATHTFSHYYCLAEGATSRAFEVDLQKALYVGEQNGVLFKSIVFPRNQIDPSHLSICEANGIQAYRGNQDCWLYDVTTKKDHIFKRLLRLVDTYINLTGSHIYSWESLIDGFSMVNVPASQFLRPFSRKLKWLEPLKIRRIKKGMTKAAKTGQIYHLWWHPHNFGTQINQNMKLLSKIISHYNELNAKYGFESCSMSDISNYALTESNYKRGVSHDVNKESY